MSSIKHTFWPKHFSLDFVKESPRATGEELGEGASGVGDEEDKEDAFGASEEDDKYALGAEEDEDDILGVAKTEAVLGRG